MANQETDMNRPMPRGRRTKEAQELLDLAKAHPAAIIFEKPELTGLYYRYDSRGTVEEVGLTLGRGSSFTYRRTGIDGRLTDVAINSPAASEKIRKIFGNK